METRPLLGVVTDTDLFAVVDAVELGGRESWLPATAIAAYALGGAVTVTPTGAGDSTRINAALTKVAAAGGGRVLLGPGLYDITSTVLIPSNTTLEGSGMSTILKLHALANCKTVTNANLATGNSNFAMRNLQVDGNGNNQDIVPVNSGVGYDAVYFIFSTNVEVSSCWIHDGNRHNLFISDSSQAVRIESNRLENSLGLTNIAVFNSNDIVITGNVCSGANETGTKIDSSHTVAIVGNTYFNNTTIQIYVTGSSSITITGNSCRGGQSGVRIVSNDFTTVVGNSIRSHSQNGIAIYQNCNKITIVGNMIRDIGSATANTYDGINIDDTGSPCNYVLINGNTITDANAKMRYGIRSLNLTTLVTVGTNLIIGAVTAPVLLVGTGNRTGSFSAMLTPGTIGTVNNATGYLFATIVTVGGSTNANIAKFYVPKSCVLVAAYVLFHNSGTLSSGETSTVAVRVNNTTDTTISAAVVNSAVNTEANNAAMNLSLAAGDYLAIKWTTPTWVTAPTNVRPAVVLYFE